MLSKSHDSIVWRSKPRPEEAAIKGSCVHDRHGHLQSSFPALVAPLIAILIRHLQAVLVLILQKGKLRPRKGQQQNQGQHSVPGSECSALSTALEGAETRPQTQVRVSGCLRAQTFLLSGSVLALSSGESKKEVLQG